MLQHNTRGKKKNILNIVNDTLLYVYERASSKRKIHPRGTRMKKESFFLTTVSKGKVISLPFAALSAA